MAEERIIDDDIDKNKKYRIVKGEDGEEELVINEPEEEEELTFEAEDDIVDQGEDGVLTAEQYEAAMVLKAEEEARLKQELAELRAKARKYREAGRFSDTLECIAAAEELAPGDSEIKCAKLEAITQAFTDFSAADGIAKACAEVEECGDSPFREELYEKHGAAVSAMRSENSAKLEELSGQYLAEQQGRRDILAPRRAKALKVFIGVLAVFAVFLIAAIVCSTMMFSMQNGVMLVVTIVLAVIAFICFIALIFAARSFAAAARMYSANERDYSTKLGRERAALRELCATLDAVYSAINVKNDDIS